MTGRHNGVTKAACPEFVRSQNATNGHVEEQSRRITEREDYLDGFTAGSAKYRLLAPGATPMGRALAYRPLPQRRRESFRQPQTFCCRKDPPS
ncbi:hypothetical protein MTO96_028124 [Rhipicephalus appendiculatus]